MKQQDRDLIATRLIDAELELAEMPALRRSIEQLTAELDALRTALEATRAELDATSGSVSWRLTAPLRRARALLTRRRHRVRA